MRDAERFESKDEDLAVTDAVLFLIWGEALKQRWNPPWCFRAHNSSQELFAGNVAWKSFRLRVSEPFSNRGQVWGPCFYLDMSRSFVKISAGQSHGVCFIRCLLHSDDGLSRVGEKPAPAWVIDVTDAMAMALWHQWIFDLSQLRQIPVCGPTCVAIGPNPSWNLPKVLIESQDIGRVHIQLQWAQTFSAVRFVSFYDFDDSFHVVPINFAAQKVVARVRLESWGRKRQIMCLSNCVPMIFRESTLQTWMLMFCDTCVTWPCKNDAWHFHWPNADVSDVLCFLIGRKCVCVLRVNWCHG